MENEPYAIYLKNRPVRTAYIIDEKVLEEGGNLIEDFFDNVICKSYCNWGGRTNPIVPYRDNNFDQLNWSYLSRVDADYVITLSELAADFVKKIDRRLQPYHLREEQLSNLNHWSREGVYIFPTIENLRVFEEATLIVFDFAENCDPVAKRFIIRNFGTYDQWIDPKDKSVRRNFFEEKALRKLPVERILISDRASLANALVKLSGTHHGDPDYKQGMNFVVPSMLPSIDLPGNNKLSFGDYQVIVGDGYKDILEFWNGASWKQNFLKPHVRQLWLPTELARDPILALPIYYWLHRYTGAGNSNAQSVEFISHTLDAKILEEIRQKICNSQSWEIPATLVNSEEITNRKKEALEEVERNILRRWLQPSSSAIRYSSINAKEIILVPKPSILEKTVSSDGTWMTDVQIELKSKTYSGGHEQSWWQVPRQNSGGLLRMMFHPNVSRINDLGLFSLRVENRGVGDYRSPVKPEIKISIPDENNVIYSLITQTAYSPHLNEDIRYKVGIDKSSISRVEISDKGEYLRGLIKVFGGFWNALDFCQRQFWRKVFAKLARYDLRQESALHEKITNTISKNIERRMSPEKIAEKVLGKIGSEKAEKTYFQMADFQKILEETRQVPITGGLSYTQGSVEVIIPNYAHVSAAEMEAGLNRLVKFNVLRRGTNLSCTYCGITTSYHVDDLKQTMKCPGCGHEMILGTAEVGFGLSTLAEMGIIQGQLPTLLAYTSLANQCRHSFMYAPSLELFLRQQDEIWHEVDVFALCDGDFVIGSVKGGEKPVTEDDFNELFDVVEKILPQRAVIFSAVSETNGKTQQLMENFKTRLAAIGVVGEHFQLPTF